MTPDSLVARRPLAWAALLFGLGVVLADGAGTRTSTTCLIAALTAVAMAAAALAVPTRMVHPGRLVATLALGAAVCALGGARIVQHQRPPPRDVAHLAPRSPRLTLAGRVADVPRRSYGRVQFTLSVDTLGAGGPRPLASTGRVHVRADTAGQALLRQGMRVVVSGVLVPPPPPRNPAAFDFGAYLHRQGVRSVVEADGVAGLGAPAGVLPRARAAVAAVVARHVPSSRGQALASALLLADRSGIAPEAREAFARTGLVHVLAVSGLHVMLLGLALYRLLGPLLLRIGLRWRMVAWLRAGIVLAVLGGYAALTGGQPPVVRAVVMAAFALGATLAQRPSGGLNALGGAALVVLAADPDALATVGFQLSFAAVAGILLLEPRLRALVPGAHGWRGARRRALSSLTVGLAATLGTAPVLLVHFGRVPLAGVVLTPPAVALAAATLLGGLLMLASAALPAAAAAFGAAADAAARTLYGLADFAGRHASGVAVEGFVSDPAALLAWLLGLAALAALHRPRLRWRLGAGACAACAVAFAPRPGPPALDLLVLDVGHGDALVVSTPGGRHLLVDAGPRSRYVDAGVRVVLPHLRRAGVERLDALVVTHADADHLGGALSVLRGMPVARVLTNGRPTDTALYRAFAQLLDSLGLVDEPLRPGDTLALDPAIRIRALGPAADAGSDNDASVVLQLAYGATRMLLLGDAEEAAEQGLVEQWRPWLRSDVVKVGHHGSRTSSTPPLVAAVGGPAHAVVSVGRRHGLPDEEVVRRWSDAAGRLHNTARDGAVWLRSDGRQVRVVPWRRLPAYRRFRR